MIAYFQCKGDTSGLFGGELCLLDVWPNFGRGET